MAMVWCLWQRKWNLGCWILVVCEVRNGRFSVAAFRAWPLVGFTEVQVLIVYLLSVRVCVSDNSISLDRSPFRLRRAPSSIDFHQFWPTLRGFRNAEGEEAKVVALEQVMEVIMLLEDAFAKCGKGKDYFGCDTIGYLDIAIGSFLGVMRAAEKMTDTKLIDKTKTPGLFGWTERFGSNVAVKDVFPETETLVEYAKMILARAKAQ